MRKRTCKHCVELFQPVRKGHIFCSETCRKLSFKAKNRAKSQAQLKRRVSEKIKKLANSTFGLYLVKEIRRAGTVQILHGHNAGSLNQLVKLRRRCTASGGYEGGESLGFFELSHIYPVKGKGKIGLLNTKNLVIAPYQFNRKHASKIPVEGYLGSSINSDELLDTWKVTQKNTSLEILKLSRRYLGEEFDIWLKSHLLSITQKQLLIKKLEAVGYNSSLLKSLRLKDLKALAEEKEIHYFSINITPDDTVNVIYQELRRLELNNEFQEIFYILNNLSDTFEPPEFAFEGSQDELTELVEFITLQALMCIHGQKYSTIWQNKPIESYFNKVSYNTPNYFFSKYSDNDEIL